MGRTTHQTSTKEKNSEITVICEWRFSVMGRNFSGFVMDVIQGKKTEIY